MGTPTEAAAFCRDRAPRMRCLSDMRQIAYRGFGIGQAGVAELFTPAVAIAGAQAALAGHMPGPVVGGVRQMPAAFVIDRGGIVLLAHYGRDIADLPQPETLLAALPAPMLAW